MSAPPISEDDLNILTGTTLAANVLRGDAEQARRIRDVVLHIIDPHRSPWIGEDRGPTREERRIAVVADVPGGRDDVFMAARINRMERVCYAKGAGSSTALDPGRLASKAAAISARV